MKLRAVLLFALTLFGLGLVVAGTPARPAWACSCAGRGQDERAELIVVGTITDVTATGVRLAVESVEKGTLGAAATLRLAVGRDGNTCGYDFRTGVRYRVNSTNGRTGLCAGVRELSTTAPPSRTAPASVSAATPAPTPSPRHPWLIAGTLLMVLTAGLAAAVWRHHHRSR